MKDSLHRNSSGNLRKINDRNKLNDLTAKEWIINTKSVWKFSDYHLNDQDNESIRYTRNLILFFTKKGNLVLNPDNHGFINEITREEGRIVLSQTKESVDFILCIEETMFTTYLEYSMNLTTKVKSKYLELFELLKDKRYLCVVIKNFYIVTNDTYSELIVFHSDLSDLLMQIGFKLKGVTAWVPKSKSSSENELDPNTLILNEFILIFRKEGNHRQDIQVNPESFSNTSVVKGSYFYPSFIASIPPPRDIYKSQHPATFPESDIKNLISFFTLNIPNPKILDPFCGVGSTLIACMELNVEGWGIELTEKWIQLTKKRFHNYKTPVPLNINGKTYYPRNLTNFIEKNHDLKKHQIIQQLIVGDAREKLELFEDEFFDLIVTSPPYWGILTKKIDHKTKKERVSKGLRTKYTLKGEDESFEKDLANIPSYEAFLCQLEGIYGECFKKIKENRYMIVIVSDFRDGSIFHLYHCTTIKILRDIGFKLTGLTILHQENKDLYPYGYPYAFVSNIHHQYVVIVKKENNSP